MNRLKAPFPWFGGKSRVAHIVWDRFGNVPHYVEPFAGSLAVLLGRPHEPGIETVNDRDCYLANFWRAISADPEQTAYYASWPINEADLHARHKWLQERDEFRERMMTDPEYYDCRIAGWWVWGQCLWIGSGWCSEASRTRGEELGVWGKRPNLGGQGIFRKEFRGNRTARLLEYFTALSRRLREVRVCCGDWTRVLAESVTGGNVTGIFLDPPYSAERCDELYAVDGLEVARHVREWAIANGNNPMLRIALCGYEGEHEMPEDWECVTWVANGGYALRKKALENRYRERIWFSPHCLRSSLFRDL